MKNLLARIVWGGAVISFPIFASAQELNLNDEILVQQYRAEAEVAADEMLRNFQGTLKPRFQMAYEDYLRDLQIIAQTGKAPDNEALYDDLRVMKNNQTFIYSDSQE